MGDALNSGVSGLMAHQKMLDVSGNNLANMNTNGFKSSRVNFSDLLGETIREASQPTDVTGGTNPMQAGSGVQVSSIDRDMTQGTMTNTGQPLDMAIEGAGFFVVSDGTREIYTRVGAFSIDAEYYLVDPASGYRVQRTGSFGVNEGFQSIGESNIRVPYDTALPAQSTSRVTYSGNLSSDQIDATAMKLGSGMEWTNAAGNIVSGTDEIWSSSLIAGATGAQDHVGTLTIAGARPDGTAVSSNFQIYDGSGVNPATTFDDLAAAIRAAYNNEVSVSVVNGQIRIEDVTAGYSVTDVGLSYTAAAAGTTADLPVYWEMLEPGGNLVKKTNIEIFDSQGSSHVLSGAFVKSDTPNSWDFVMTSITGDVSGVTQRRVRGITFNPDGSYAGILSGDDPQVKIQLAGGMPSLEPTLDFGTIGEFNGLSQFGGSSTAAPTDQDGYEAGYLSRISVSSDGIMVGVFTNGIRRDLAAVKVATFQNPAGLKAIGGNYFEATANSGDAISGQALSGGAGSMRGGALEKSNVVVATEFVNLIQAQNGYQANARTIRVANDMLKELTNLIR